MLTFRYLRVLVALNSCCAKLKRRRRKYWAVVLCQRSWFDGFLPKKKWERISRKENLLAALAKEGEELTAKKGEVQENESQLRRDQRDCLAIPSLSAIDRSGRYETRNVRHRYKVEARLAELQARPRRNAKLKSGGDGVAESDHDIQFCQTNPTGSGEPQVGEAKARVATLEEQVAREKSGSPEVDPIVSPAN